MRYGFIGLGNLGGHLAASLLRSGFDVVVHDRDPAAAERLITAGAVWADSAGALAGQSDAVLTCLPSPQVSNAVLNEILKAARPGLTWIEMSTLGRDEILRLAAKAAERGVTTMELPVTGGVHLAAQGKITMLAGGDKELIDRHRPALEAMGDQIFYMGPLGSAAVIKVITNMLAFIHLVADGEALMLAKRGGLDLAQAWRAIKASSGNSFVHETEGQLILNGSYDVGFSMDLALKDLGFAMNFGETFDVPLALAEHTHAIFLKGKEAYGGSAQSTQIVKLLEEAVGTDLRADGFPARLE
ncbi:3-hydroxyisobutyrate dehydrogenase [Rhizobium sp. RU20A]|uniref:NAD(P)-dependent oxidoreductase n=1 Tax=Rhizobium sp. RU20A TaxID=1907412 RepID=UPI0009570AFD|nr:NAD(P)-dependent oxidoreductase [Rhizobium sp. RU20A]SIQ62408.1 3-hydroxyisobutyrate dehydrogenase [Rhizobium sp. RU20A]